ncbi:OCIA domain-containing protein 1-like [Diorhabda sublineata]|uniref:OCIA domain-containing protein 1-like n=1 Tax=Diorhabda sublineata TaxID=1163346 RepID=UPI0024E0B93D|nr:OCIA domain-containing protein 1-like [Diorhabda sublineata]
MASAPTETTETSRPPGPAGGRPQLSADELRVIRECMREGFYQRCLPLSAILGGAAYYGVKSGYLKGNARFGAIPKVLLAVIVGFFAGRFSYRSVCAEKLKQLPDSKIGEMLRKSKGPGVGPRGAFIFGPFSAPYYGLTPSNVAPEAKDK